MATTAKFTCNEISKRTGWGVHKFLYSAKFSAVTGTSTENESFFAATPSGSIEVSTVKEDHFEVGKTYLVHFTESE